MGSVTVAYPQSPPGRPGWWRTLGAVLLGGFGCLLLWWLALAVSMLLPGGAHVVVERVNESGPVFPGDPAGNAAAAVLFAVLLTGPLVWALDWRGAEEHPPYLWVFVSALIASGSGALSSGDDGTGSSVVVLVVALRYLPYLSDGRFRPSPVRGRTLAEALAALAVVAALVAYGAAAARPLAALDDPVDVRSHAGRLTAEVGVANHGPRAVVVQGRRIAPGVGSSFTVRLPGTCAGLVDDGLRLPYVADGTTRMLTLERVTCSGP
jgi:hypothetical protein